VLQCQWAIWLLIQQTMDSWPLQISPCAKKARTSISMVNCKTPTAEEVLVENERLIAAVASPMRPRRISLGAEIIECDQRESAGSRKAQLNAVPRLSFEGARPLKKSRTEDCPSAKIFTPLRTTGTGTTQALQTPMSTWTPDQRSQLREKIQALFTKARDTSPSASSNESVSRGSSRSSSPCTSRSSSPRSSSPRTPEDSLKAQLFKDASPPQNGNNEGNSPPPPPPGSPSYDPFDDTCVPPPPPDSPPPDTRQVVTSSPDTAVRRGCVWPTSHPKKTSAVCSHSGLKVETAADVEADIRRLIALHAVSNILADSLFA